MSSNRQKTKPDVDIKRAALVLLAFLCGGAIPIQMLTVSFGYAQYFRGIKPMNQAVPVAHDFASAIYIPFILLPALVVLSLIVVYCRRHYPDISRRIVIGAATGAVATIALDAVRLTGVVHGWLPADTPVPFGKMVTGSEVFAIYFPVGMLTHYAFGANFGIFYTFIWGKRGSYRKAAFWGIVWALLIELGMMTLPPMAPALGPFGMDYKWPQFFLTTLFAHVLFGIALGLFAEHFLRLQDRSGIFGFVRGRHEYFPQNR